MPVSPTMAHKGQSKLRSAHRIVIFAEPNDRAAQEIATALHELGAAPSIVSLKMCGMNPHAIGTLRIPGFETDLPSGAIVRSVPSGSFEQVTLRLGILHALRESGVTVWNDARAIEACVDKSMTTCRVSKAGLLTPETWTAQSHEEAVALVASECIGDRPLVLKPLFGAQGRGLRLVRTADDLPPEDEVAGVYYFQRFIQPAGERWEDYRLFVCGGSVIAGMRRIGQSWITNIKQGAEAHPLVLTRELMETAGRAARAVGADYAGVDLIHGKGGVLYTLEVNSMPAWSGLEKANPGLSVASILVERFLQALDVVFVRRKASKAS
jgi:tetrahydromethanopterin:alpha-L-glutamate ligase